jgi:hypothetical protein
MLTRAKCVLEWIDLGVPLMNRLVFAMIFVFTLTVSAVEEDKLDSATLEAVGVQNLCQV